MKAKLLKSIQEMFVQYHLKNENGHTIATSLFPIPTEVEYAANSRGITLQKLSLKNCQAIERGYDLDELTKTIFPDKIFTTDEEYETPIDGSPYQWGFKVGFQKCLELMGDKKFSRDDMIRASDWYVDTKGKKSIDELIESLQKNEWDVEIEMESNLRIGEVTDDTYPKGFPIQKPKLDAEGCLILKLKSE